MYYILLIEQSAPCMHLNIRDTRKSMGVSRNDGRHHFETRVILNKEWEKKNHLPFCWVMLGLLIYIHLLYNPPSKKKIASVWQIPQIPLPDLFCRKQFGNSWDQTPAETPLNPSTPSGVLAKQTVAPMPCGSTTSSSTPSIGWPSKGR